MKPHTRYLLPAVVLLGTAWQAQAAFSPVDTFNSRSLGNLAGQGSWVVNPSASTASQVIIDPSNPINKLLHHTGANDLGLPLPSAIANNSTGTLFLRVRRASSSNDLSFGLSDVAATSSSVGDFGSFEVQAVVSNTIFRGRDGGSAVNANPSPTILDGVWYKVWIVADTTNDTWRYLIQSDGDPAYQTQTELFSTTAGNTDWDFRNGVAANPLVTMQITSNSGNSSLYFDDIYLDTSGQNLADPTIVEDPDTDDDGLDDAWEIFYFGSIETQSGTDGVYDGDQDGLSNEQEETLGTNPTLADTDGDGLLDGEEVDGSANVMFGNQPTNPKLADSDNDGVNDFQEVQGTQNVAFFHEPTNPNAADTDMDGWADRMEFLYGTNPNSDSSVPDVYELIGLVKRNGSFEYRDGVIKTTNFKQGWDGVGGVDDVDGWSTWAEQTTTSTDSGIETSNATHGSVKGFCQNGNGAKNMTQYKAREGDIIRLTYDRVNGYTSGNTYLLYDGSDLGVGFVPIPTSPTQLNTSNGTYEIVFTVPAGSPAIGRPIGVGIRNGTSGSWPGWDKVVLTVKDTDSDGDGLSDFDEDRYFGNNDDNATPEELAVTTGEEDYDQDGYSNIEEIEAGSNPNDIASTPSDLDGDGLADAWEISYFGSITAQDGNGDPDGDFSSNELEETASTHPNDAASWPDLDQDLLNDGWEMHYFSGSLDEVAAGDPDGDGFDNLAEMEAGSHPNDIDWSPAVPKLAHRWSFNGSLNDSAGGSHAVIRNDASANLGQTSVLSSTGLTLTGGARATTDWVQLGSHLIGGKKTPVTIELWATTHGVQSWSRIWDFYSSTTESFYMTWTAGTAEATDRVQWIDGATTTLDHTNAPYTLGTKHHILVTIVPAVNTDGELPRGSRVTWYSQPAGSGLIGPQKGFFTTTNSLADLNDLINALGRSAFGDNNANATYDEVRIWDGEALTGARQTLHVAGPENASLADSDSDGLYDAWEMAYFGNLDQSSGDDPDGDLVLNEDEQASGSHPGVAASVPGDVDGDTLDDDWEIANFRNLNQEANGDPDGDFDTNAVEQENGTNPISKSSFYSSTADSVPDSWKSHYGIMSQTGSDDFEPGSPVGDGLTNLNEFFANTSPIDRDSDDDGLEDGAEVLAGTNPLNPDSDGDGLTDGDEVHTYGTNPLQVDTDGDTFSDKYEIDHGGNPTNAAVVPGQTAGFVKIEDFEGPGMNLGQTFNGVNGWLADTANIVVARPNGSGKAGHWVNGAMRKSLTHHARQILNGNTGTLFMQVYMPGSDSSLIDHSFSLSDTTGTGTGDHEAQAGYINGTMTVRNGGGNFTSTYTHEMGAWFNVWMVADNAADTVKVWVESPANASGKVLLNESQVCSFRNGVASNPLIQILFLEFDTDSIIIDNLYVDATAENLNNPTQDGVPDADADGLPDAWEITYFGNTAETGTGDFDHDGTDNLTEYRLGLIPNLGSSRFALVRSSSGVLQWPSQQGLSFKIERSTTLAAGSWATLEANYPAAGSPATSTSYTDPAPPAGKAFYRITLNP